MEVAKAVVWVLDRAVAEGDLLEWEEKAKTFGAGTVAWHPGGTLGSHYAIHCKMNGIPIFTFREPAVGEVLTMCACDPKPKSKTDWCGACDGYAAKAPELDVEEALKGMSHGVSFQTNYADAVKLVLGACHNVNFFDAKESRLLGCAAMLCVRLAMCACFGEATHKGHKFVTGYSGNYDYSKPWANLEEAVKRFNEAREKFYQGGWSKFYGGPAWKKCADATAEFWNRIVFFAQSKRLDDLKQVVSTLSKVVNLAHNNGWWFNKFIDPNWFNCNEGFNIDSLRIQPGATTSSSADGTWASDSSLALTSFSSGATA